MGDAFFCVNRKAIDQLVKIRSAGDLNSEPEGCYTGPIELQVEEKLSGISTNMAAFIRSDNGQHECRLSDGQKFRCNIEVKKTGVVARE
jgi:hypothetical protein